MFDLQNANWFQWNWNGNSIGIHLNKDCKSFAYGGVQAVAGISPIIFALVLVPLPHNPWKLGNSSEGIVVKGQLRGNCTQAQCLYNRSLYLPKLLLVWYKVTQRYWSTNRKVGEEFFGSGSFMIQRLLQITLLSTVLPMMSMKKIKILLIPD